MGRGRPSNSAGNRWFSGSPVCRSRWETHRGRWPASAHAATNPGMIRNRPRGLWGCEAQQEFFTVSACEGFLLLDGRSQVRRLEEHRAPGAPVLRDAPRLPSRHPWWDALGRRRPRDQAGPAVGRRAQAHLVRSRGHAAVLPAAPHGVLGGAPPVGRRGGRLPPGEHPSPRRGGLPGGGDHAAAGAPRCVARRLHLRPASGERGIRCLDIGAEEHALRRLLPWRRVCLPGL